MLRKAHVRPFLREEDGELGVDFLEDRGDGAVVAFLDRLCRLVRKLEGRPRSIVREALRRQERRIRDARRLAGVSKSLLDRCEFRPPEGADRAPEVREAFFRARGERWPPVPGDRNEPYRRAADELGLPVEEVERLLYADDPSSRVLTRAPGLGGEELLRAYDLDLARGVLLDAVRMTVTARGAWGDVFRAVKLARLMYRIEAERPASGSRGDPAEEGGGGSEKAASSTLSGSGEPPRPGSGEPTYRVHLTGPAASFVVRPQRYGRRFARVVPALARAPGWALEAEVDRDGRRLAYRLDAGTLPVEPEGSPTDRARYDSSWERSLAREFAEKIGPDRDGWTLHREATPVPLGPTAGGGTELFLPDFTVRHEDGREALVEIVGYWTPEYLQEKIRKVAAASLDRLVLVVYRDLAAGGPEAAAGGGDDPSSTPGGAGDGRADASADGSWESVAPGPVVRFARKPKIGEVMEAVERAAR